MSGELTDEESTAMINEWTHDDINSVLDQLWSSALDSQARNYVNKTTRKVGPLDEAGHIRKKTNAIRRARKDLDRLYDTSK